MSEDMSFVEGIYRIDNAEWRIFIFLRKSADISQASWENSTWESGTSGIVFRVPLTHRLDKFVAARLLSEAIGVDEWTEVLGPDSMQLR